MTLRSQEVVAEETRAFAKKWGLKYGFIANSAGIDSISFSRFLNCKLALSSRQINRLIAYMADYEKRNI